MRSSLDNLAFALARLKMDPPQNPKNIAFPIYEDKIKFEKQGRKSIEQLPEQAALIIENLQPFQRIGSQNEGFPYQDPLILLQQMNNDDKHQIPSVVIMTPEKIEHKFYMEFYSQEKATASFMHRPEHLIPGLMLAECVTTKPLKLVKGSCTVDAVVKLQTDKVSMEIIDLLWSLHNYVNLVASQFVVFFQDK